MPLKTRLLNRLTHRLLVNRTMAVSGDVKRTLQTNAGLDGDRVEVVPNGIDLAVGPPAPAPALERHEGKVLLGYFGRLSPEKGLSTLLRSFALALDSGQPLHLFLAGEGPQRQDLERLAFDLNIESSVTFLGFRDDARSLMSEMDAVVHVPEYEGFGLVILEGMAAAKPLIVNDAPGGMTDLVQDGVNGLVVPAGSIEHLASAIRRLAGNAGERQRLGANGLKICGERYSAPVFARRVESVYDSLLATAGPSPNWRPRLGASRGNQEES
jgi:glycosyltransferase involved in cell wall biosynthesis